jgi:2-keto-4-pentenoate hydratase/2-oxohepta-3-ene-1,7-dioic acid hydratase in catechol pathway
VNNELRQSSDTSQLVFNIPQILQFCSQGSTLAAGSVILTGTPSGVGYAMNPPQFLRPGDKVEITIEKIGTLINGVEYA